MRSTKRVAQQSDLIKESLSQFPNGASIHDIAASTPLDLERRTLQRRLLQLVAAGDVLTSFAFDTVFGLENYEFMLDDRRFWNAMRNSAYFTLLSVPGGMAISLLVALVMNQKLRGIGIFRTMFYMPYVVPQVAAALVWVWMLSARYGAVNTVLGYGGIDGPRWLQDPDYVLTSIVIMSLWGVGGSAVIYLAGLQNIPQQLYEAAKIDGAGPLRRFRYVTLPMLTPTIFFQLVLGLIGVFQTFTPAFIAAGPTGGPLQSALFYMVNIYNRAFGASGAGSRMGYASALSWIMTVFILVITIAVFRSSKYWVYYEAERNRK